MTEVLWDFPTDRYPFYVPERKFDVQKFEDGIFTQAEN